ncbi:hypothetical protein ACTFIU_008492 [Dictyostelium citrinum]
MFQIIYLLFFLQSFKLYAGSYVDKVISERLISSHEIVNPVKILNIFYSSDNCTGPEIDVYVYDECYFQGRIETNHSHVLFYNDKSGSKKFCDNFDTITSVELKDVCRDTKDGGSYIYKQYESSDSKLMNIVGSIVKTFSISNDCSKYEVINVKTPNVCIEQNDYFTLFNISKNSISTYKFKDPNRNTDSKQ